MIVYPTEHDSRLKTNKTKWKCPNPKNSLFLLSITYVHIIEVYFCGF